MSFTNVQKVDATRVSIWGNPYLHRADNMIPQSRGRNRRTRLITKSFTNKSVTWFLEVQQLLETLINRKRTPNLQSKAMNKIPDSEFSCAESQYFTTEEQSTLEGRRSRSLADRDPPASVTWISYRIHKKDITGSSKKSSSKWERVIPDSKTIFLSVDLPPTSIKSFGAPTNRNAERTQMHTKGPKSLFFPWSQKRVHPLENRVTGDVTYEFAV